MRFQLFLAEPFHLAETASIASLTSSRVEQKAQQNRGRIDLVGLQSYWLGGVAKSGAKPSRFNCAFKLLGTSVMTVR